MWSAREPRRRCRLCDLAGLFTVPFDGTFVSLRSRKELSGSPFDDWRGFCRAQGRASFVTKAAACAGSRRHHGRSLKPTPSLPAGLLTLIAAGSCFDFQHTCHCTAYLEGWIHPGICVTSLLENARMLPHVPLVKARLYILREGNSIRSTVSPTRSVLLDPMALCDCAFDWCLFSDMDT